MWRRAYSFSAMTEVLVTRGSNRRVIEANTQVNVSGYADSFCQKNLGFYADPDCFG
jgi:hypothetical protein